MFMNVNKWFCCSIGGSTATLSRAGPASAADGGPREHSRSPRTVPPPSAYFKRIVIPHAANALASECHPNSSSDRASPFHHEDYFEKNKKTRRKSGADYGETPESPKLPPYIKKEPEFLNIDIKNKKLDGATVPKFIKSRDRTKRKIEPSGMIKGKTKPRSTIGAAGHKDSPTSDLPHALEQQKLEHNKQKRPIIDSTKQRQQSVSPNRTDRQSSISPDNYRCRPPMTSPDNAERRQTAPPSPDRTVRGTLSPETSTGQTKGLHPSPPKAEQRQTKAPKDGNRRGRRLVARGDSRAAAVAEAVAHGSSNSAYPAWLRRH